MSKITKKTLKKNKALFLDRDGVINEDYGYVYQIKKFHLIKNIHVLINVAQKIGYKIIIITNQAGIGKKIFSINDFYKLTRHMKNLLIKHNCSIDAVYYCPFHPSNGIGKYLKDSYDRKPNPGMLLKAKKKFNLDMSKSVLIGDKISDIQAGKKSFVKTNILFNKNKKKYKKINKKSDQFIEINNLTEALKYL
jgi:D-glycero-D-manno-heptose 1,7-bisphosphate phosphatase